MKQQKISRERKKYLLTRLKQQLGKNKKYVYLISFFSWFQFLMRVISFGYIAKIIVSLVKNETINYSLFIMIILSLNIFGFIVAMLSKKIQGIPSQYARNKLKAQFLEAFEAKQDDFKNQSVNDILTIASQGIDMLDTYYSHYLNLSYRTYFNCLTVLLIVSYLFPLGAIIFIISLPLIPVFIILIQKRSKKIMEHYWGTYMDVGNQFIDHLDGLNTLFSYQTIDYFKDDFIKKAEQFRLSTMELLKFQLQSVGYMDFVMYGGIAVSGYFAVQAFYHNQLSLFSIVFFVLIAAEFFAPIREMGYGMHLVMMNTKMADRIFTFLDNVRIEKDVSKNSINTIKNVTFKDVSFAYSEINVLNHLNMEINKGEIFGICGVSGVGKTTIAKLLQKKETNYSGDILIDGSSLQNISKNNLFNHIAYINSDAYLFNTSIIDNLKIGCQLSETEIISYLKQKSLLSFAFELEDGLNTIVGENGNRLSFGQKQQIACVRALLSNKKMYIFDEVTSSVDIENEKIIFDLIKIAKENAVVIFISHKMKQILHCDRVLFMEKQNYAINSPKQLLNLTQFANLVATQNELEEIYDAK